MTEMPKQRWRFELGRTPKDCKIFLNDEQWWNVVSLKIEAGMNTSGNPLCTKLTLEVFPHEVIVDIHPSLQGDIEDGFFRERRAPGPTHQPL